MMMDQREKVGLALTACVVSLALLSLCHGSAPATDVATNEANKAAPLKLLSQIQVRLPRQVTVAEAVDALKEQSDGRVTGKLLRKIPEGRLELQAEKMPFWQAVAEVSQSGRLGIMPWVGDLRWVDGEPWLPIHPRVDRYVLPGPGLLTASWPFVMKISKDGNAIQRTGILIRFYYDPLEADSPELQALAMTIDDQKTPLTLEASDGQSGYKAWFALLGEREKERVTAISGSLSFEKRDRFGRVAVAMAAKSRTQEDGVVVESTGRVADGDSEFAYGFRMSWDCGLNKTERERAQRLWKEALRGKPMDPDSLQWHRQIAERARLVRVISQAVLDGRQKEITRYTCQTETSVP